MSTHPPSAPRDVEVVRTVAALRRRLAAARETGRGVTLVPTMGAFHEGHLELMRRAGAGGHLVVVTLFVNPSQFAAGEDLERYPRDEAGDLAAAAGAGADVVFAPPVEEVYPEGFATVVSVGGPAERLEGAARPTHFAGVATVVAKLLLAARPDRVVFGRKDAQQVAVVRRLMRDLHLDDVEMIVVDTVREPDGLALSSRNAYLDPDDRRAAGALHRGLQAAAELAAAGEADAAAVAAAAARVIAAEPLCRLEYAEVVDPDTFAPLSRLPAPGQAGSAPPPLLVVAARVGSTRLIDNVPLPTPSPRRTDVPPRTRTMLKSKIHRATVTDANLNYVGSITVDRELLDAADIRPFEQVHVVNIANGARFETYAIEGAPGGGDICLNGAAARLAHPGDLVIVLSYAEFAEEDLAGHQPLVVHVDEANRPLADQVADTLPEGWRLDPGGLDAPALRARKGGARLAVLTAYDYPTALALDGAGLDAILVGDSLGEVELGGASTRGVTLDMMVHHVRAVRRGVRATHVVADLPADSYRDPAEAVRSARALMGAGADSVKLEGAMVPQVEAIVAAGIPVMGHVGLLPQTATEYRRQGTEPEEAERILEDARALDRAGCYAIVVEAVPAELAARITAGVGCPTIGIAAGAETDGQVLVSTDLIGQLPEPPRWMTPKADVFSVVEAAARAFAEEVRAARVGATRA